ncbi:MAG: RHS repeat domain-containing protein [Flammeovirgaceae bacterium]
MNKQVIILLMSAVLSSMFVDVCAGEDGRKEGQLRLGKKNYELSNHLGNVLAVVTDNINMTAAEGVFATVVSSTYYYPFGLEMKGRTYSNDKYRYGFNGREKVDEIAGSGGHIDYGERGYDPLRCQWWSVDGEAKAYPGISPYAFTGNNPIANREIDGNAFETPWDAFNVALDIASLGANLAAGNYVDAGIDAAGLIYDGAATLIPGLPGGAGTLIKASRVGKTVIKSCKQGG